MLTALPTPAPYPATGGAMKSWQCEGTSAAPAFGGTTTTTGESCVVTAWGTDPAVPQPLATVGVSNFPAAPVYPAPLATVAVTAASPLPVHEASPVPATLAGNTIQSVAECGTTTTPACEIADAGASTPAMVGGFSLLLVLGAASLVLGLRGRSS